jgi:hypothetical protein
MTSSFMISQLHKTQNKDGAPWHYGLPGSPLGGMEDSYIRLQGNCHPDFITYPIGRAEGVKMCVRKPLVGANNVGCSPLARIGEPLHAQAEWQKRRNQGYNRGSVRLYDPQANFPIQEWNPQYYADRRIPWEQDLLARDYLRWPLKYSGTGIDTLHAPAQLRDTGKPYYQYGYSFTPKDGWQYGDRTATRPDQSEPEIKYDVTRLHQPYTIWKNEQEYMGAKLPNGKDVNSLDSQGPGNAGYQKRIV